MSKKQIMLKYIMLLDFLLILFVSISGIVDQNIYENRVNNISLSELLGEDSSNLLFSIVSILLLFYNRKSFLLIRIVLIGLLSYFIYMYSYYSFSILSSSYFIIYMLIFSLSLFLFIFEMIEVTKIDMVINNKYPRKIISYFFIIVVLIMSFLEFPDIIKKTILQNQAITQFQIFYVLDLSIVFPSMIIIAIMNFLKKRTYCIWSGIILIKIITIMPALLFNELFFWIKNGKFIDFNFVIISNCFLLSSAIVIFLYKNGIDWNSIEKTSPNKA